MCVCWSPDGRYVVTGGQDDLVSIWSFHDRRIVARCEGHHSWVSSVAFDPWRCDDRTYRFGSVGNDCRLLLWDFSVGMLHKPKAVRPENLLPYLPIFPGIFSLLPLRSAILPRRRLPVCEAATDNKGYDISCF